jgi:hypothetical protein
MHDHGELTVPTSRAPSPLARKAAGLLAGLCLAFVMAWSPGHVSPAYATHGIYIQPAAMSPAGSGRITTRDGTIHCVVSFGITISGPCEFAYPPGVSVTIDFAAEADSLACDTATYACASAFTKTITTDFLARFNTIGFKKVLWEQSVKLSGTGSGTVTGPGISCGEACSVLLPISTQVTLTATAAPGSHFTGWDNEGPCSIEQTSVCSYGVVNDSPVYATFMLDPATPSPSVAPSAAPSASPSPPPSPPSTGPSSPPGATSATQPRATNARASFSLAESTPGELQSADAAQATGVAEESAAMPIGLPPVADETGAGFSGSSLVLLVLAITLAALLIGTWTWLAVGGRRPMPPGT